MTRVRANGLELHCNRFWSGPGGERPIVVCVHGLAVVDNAATSFVVGFHLALHAEVIVYDLRGHGRSDKPPSGYTVNDHVTDLFALLDALGITSPVHLVGFSYGGAIAMVAAMRHPERTASVCLFDGLVPVPGWDRDLVAEVSQFRVWEDEARSQLLAGDELEQLVAARAAESFGLRPRRAAAASRRVRELMATTTLRRDMECEPAYGPEDFARVTCPVLGFYGDRSTCYWLVDRLRELLPDITIQTIEGADHLGVFWRLEETRPALCRFIGLPAGT